MTQDPRGMIKMKLTKEQLIQLVKEELKNILQEQPDLGRRQQSSRQFTQGLRDLYKGGILDAPKSPKMIKRDKEVEDSNKKYRQQLARAKQQKDDAKAMMDKQKSDELRKQRQARLAARPERYKTKSIPAKTRAYKYFSDPKKKISGPALNTMKQFAIKYFGPVRGADLKVEKDGSLVHNVPDKNNPNEFVDRITMKPSIDGKLLMVSVRSRQADIRFDLTGRPSSSNPDQRTTWYEQEAEKLIKLIKGR